MTSPLPLTAAVLWLLAFFCSFSWIETWGAEFTALTFIFMICASALGDASGIRMRSWRVPVSPVLLAGAAMWLLALVSIAASDIPFVAWIYFFCFSLLPLSVVFFLIEPDGAARRGACMKGINLILGALAVYALYQYLSDSPSLFNGRARAPLVDPNALGAVFSLGLFLQAPGLLKAGVSKRHAAFTLLLLGGLIVTGSRGAWLALAIGAVILTGFHGIRQVPRRAWTIAGLGVIVAALLISLMPGTSTNPVMRTAISLQSENSLLESRKDIWAATVGIVKEHPLTGTGMGTFPYYYPEVRPENDTTAGYMVHNEPLQFAAEMGIGGGLLFYAVILLAGIRTCRALKGLPLGDARRTELLAPACGLLAMALHAHLNFNFHVLPCLLLAGFAFAQWYELSARALGERFHAIEAPRRVPDVVLQSVFLIIAFVMATLAAAPVYTQRLITDAAQALQAGDLARYGHAVNLADTLSAGWQDQPYLLAARLPLSALQQQDEPLEKTQKQDMIRKAGELLAKAREKNPRAAEGYVLGAQLAKIEGDAAREETLLEEAVRLNPLHLEARLALADRVAVSGKKEREVEILAGGLGYPYPEAQRQLARTYFLRAMMILEERGEGERASLAKKRIETSVDPAFSTIP